MEVGYGVVEAVVELDVDVLELDEEVVVVEVLELDEEVVVVEHTGG